MGQRTGRADLPLHGGRVPEWLASRMARLGRVMTEAIVHTYGTTGFLERLSHPTGARRACATSPTSPTWARLHGAIAAAHERGPVDFAELLLTPGVGARTVASLAQVAEVLHGAPSRFSDPARFSYAHGGKDGHPFPVPLRVYDATIETLRQSVSAAKLGQDEKLEALRRLDAQSRAMEATATGPSWDALVESERRASHRYGGRTVQGLAVPLEEASPSIASSFALK